MDGEPQEDILDRCIQRLLQGEPLDRVLRSYPDQQLRLRAELEPALALLQSTAPDPTPRGEYAAMNAMMRQVRAEAERPELPGVFRWLGTLRARPLAFQALAVVAAISVFGSIGFGASAATGTTPEPLRNILRMSTNNETVPVAGSIVSVKNGMLTVRTTAGDRSIELTSATRVRRGTQIVDVSSLTAGEMVVVTASEMHDGSQRLIAVEIRADAPPTPTHTAAIGAPVLPQADHTATGTPHDGGDGEHEDERHDGGAVSTPAPDGHEDEAEHAGTPEVSATSSGDGDHATSTPDHEDRTSEPDHGDATPTPDHESDGGGDGEHHN
jgi:hypothetical protein